MTADLHDLLFVVMPQNWAGRMWSALWQGSVALALVWIVCRVFPRIPARVRCWLWRLGLLKPFLQLIAVPQIDLALLPRARTVLAHIVSDGFARDLPTRSTLLIRLSRPMMAFWIAAAAVGMVSILSGLRKSRSMAARCVPVLNRELDVIMAELCHEMGLCQRPDVAAVDWMSPPMILRLSRGYVVVIPKDLLTWERREDLRLALAHELAHIKRRDLTWNWLPTAAKVLFAVNPLVWGAGRELGLAQEMACDEMAVRATGAGLARYGRLLLTMVRPCHGAGPIRAVASASAGAPAKVMRKRLMELTHVQDPPPLRLAGSMAALLIVCALVMPFQIVEAPRTGPMQARTAQAETTHAATPHPGARQTEEPLTIAMTRTYAYATIVRPDFRIVQLREVKATASR